MREVGDAVECVRDVHVCMTKRKAQNILGQPIVQINTPHHRAAHTVGIRKLLLQVERVLIVIRHELIAIADLHHLGGWIVLRRDVGLRNHVLNLGQRHHSSLADTRASCAETAGRAADVVACVVGEGVAAAVGCEAHVDFGQSTPADVRVATVELMMRMSVCPSTYGVVLL